MEYAELLPEIMPEVVGCPNPVAKRALRNALIQFCTESEAYRLPDVRAVAVQNISEVEFDVPDQTRVVKVVSLTYEGKPLNPASETILDGTINQWREHTGTPSAFIPRTGNQVTLYPTPESTELALNATLALTPTQSSTSIDDAFIEAYLESVIAGALNRLMTMRGQPWANPELGVSYGYQFQEAITKAKRKGQADNYVKRRVVSYGGY